MKKDKSLEKSYVDLVTAVGSLIVVIIIVVGILLTLAQIEEKQEQYDCFYEKAKTFCNNLGEIEISVQSPNRFICAYSERTPMSHGEEYLFLDNEIEECKK